MISLRNIPRFASATPRPIRLRPSDTTIMAAVEVCEELVLDRPEKPKLDTFEVIACAAEKSRCSQADVVDTIWRQHMLDVKRETAPLTVHELHLREIWKQRQISGESRKLINNT